MGFFIGKKMANVKKPGGEKTSCRDATKKAKRNTAAGEPKAENEPEQARKQGLRGPRQATPPKRPKGKEEVSREKLMKKAYLTVEKKLEDDSSKAIDDLVKLAKLEKDLGGEQKDVKEIKVRWEPSENKSSSEG